MCWSPIRRSPMPSFARRSAPISSAARSARPTSCFSTPTASRSPPTTSRSSVTSTACAPRCGRSLPGIQIEGVGDSVILTGSVSSPVEAQQAGEIAARLVGGADKVVNSIVVRGRDQVMLKVTVAEVRRDIVKQMGVDLSASMNYGTAVVNFNNTNPFTANSAPARPRQRPWRRGLAQGRLPTVTATLRAMESAGVVRTLAEPNLTAISGESATFISGGEFPIPTGVTCQPTTRRDRTMRPDGQLQEIRHLAQLHAGRADRGTDQPAGDDRSFGSLDRKRFALAAGGIADHSLDQDPPRRDHAGNSLRRLDGDGRPDPGADQAGRSTACPASTSCRFSARCSAARTSSTTRPN